MYKFIIIILLSAYFLYADNNKLIRDNVFSPYSWATYYAEKKPIRLLSMGSFPNG